MSFYCGIPIKLEFLIFSIDDVVFLDIYEKLIEILNISKQRFFTYPEETDKASKKRIYIFKQFSFTVVAFQSSISLKPGLATFYGELSSFLLYEND